MERVFQAFNLDPVAGSEHTWTVAHGRPYRTFPEGLYPAMRRWDCHANIFSLACLQNLRDHWIATGKIRMVSVETGGGYICRNAEGVPEPFNGAVRMRWPNQQAYLVKVGSNTTCRARSTEWEEAKAFIRSRIANPQPGDPSREDMAAMMQDTDKPAYARFNINPTGVLWRLRNLDALGNPRMIPVTLEMSHCAESYHSAEQMHFAFGEHESGWREHWRVDIVELETAPINLDRRACTMFCRMWHDASTGELIPENQRHTFTGATMCPHAAFGTPCYAPYPRAPKVKPTGKTPSKRKLGVPSGGKEGGRVAGKRGRKKRVPGDV